MKTINLLFSFYRTYALFSLLMTICCDYILYKWGINTLNTLVWFKVLTLSLAFLHIRNYKKYEMYYYLNLGLSKRVLWISTMAFDLILFFISLITIIKIT